MRGWRFWPGVHAGRVLTICIAAYSGVATTMRSLGGGSRCANRGGPRQ